MADYQLTETDSIIRTEDGAWIPADPANMAWVEYQAWLAKGGVPDPYVPPPPPPAEKPAPQDAVLFNHENRLRAIEGQPPLTLAEFHGD
jgi:hypothetical protein